jgi:hypothetical protein
MNATDLAAAFADLGPTEVKRIHGESRAFDQAHRDSLRRMIETVSKLAEEQAKRSAETADRLGHELDIKDAARDLAVCKLLLKVNYASGPSSDLAALKVLVD